VAIQTLGILHLNRRSPTPGEPDQRGLVEGVPGVLRARSMAGFAPPPLEVVLRIEPEDLRMQRLAEMLVLLAVAFDAPRLADVLGWFRGRLPGRGGRNRQQQSGIFTAPMDHSYRVVNGNVADGPPSTIQLQHSNNHQQGNYYSDNFSPVATVREDAPTRIFCFIEDLFFIAKIQETARKLGVKVAFVKNDKESIAELTGHEEDDRPGLIVFDLNNTNAKPLTLIPKLKAKLKRSTSIVGFLSHLQGDLKAKAMEAGCDTVMPRAAFSQNLPNLLRRYGFEEEEETNYNQ